MILTFDSNFSDADCERFFFILSFLVMESSSDSESIIWDTFKGNRLIVSSFDSELLSHNILSSAGFIPSKLDCLDSFFF